MEKKFQGFNAMAVALAAAGLAPAIGTPAAALVMARAGRFRFVLIDHHGYRRWAQDVGNDKYEYFRFTTDDCAGHEYGFQLNPRNHIVLETIWADGFSYISMEDRKKQSSYVEEGESGWLNPQGEFYSCNYAGHGALATNVLQKTWAELENAGWCHVDEAGAPGKYSFRMGSTEQKLTPAQEAWLQAHGHDLDPSGEKKRNKMPEVIELGDGTKIDAAADRAAFEAQMKKAGLKPDGYKGLGRPEFF